MLMSRRWIATVLVAGACGNPGVTPVAAPSPDAATGSLEPDARVLAPEDAFFVPPSGDAAVAGPTAPCAGTMTTAPASCAALGVTIDAQFAGKYTCFDLGPVPGLPRNKYGGLTLTLDRCSSSLLIGGDANLPTGKLYAVPVGRDAGGHVAGFTGAGVVHADAPYNDGGITFGPNQILFFTRWPSNELQQTRAGSTMADRVVDLTMLGVAQASASLAFVPPGLPAAGALKLVAWGEGQWYTVPVHPDGDVFALDAAKQDLTLPGGPEGFVYVAAGSPLFDKDSLLVSEWTDNAIAAYQIDDQGNPVLATRRPLLTGLQGAEGAYRDPATGDFFFSTWGADVDRVIVVRGFAPIVVQ
jgi:hypothetical protein